MEKNCSIITNYDKTCFSLKALKNIAMKVNNDVRYKQTPKINVSAYTRNDKSKLVNDIQTKISCNSNLDFCILNKKTDFFKEIKAFFKPEGPSRSKKWLGTLDIQNVMSHYMIKYDNFHFYGPYPMDFANFQTELTNSNFKNAMKNKMKMGVIFNQDYSTSSGSHWVSLFVDLENKTICYFDSAGDKPMKEVKKLIRDLITSAKQQNIKLKLIENEKKHQYKNTECGVYSIYFITSRLAGKSCSFLFENIIRDETMFKNREKYFRT